jgi:hypothetical protein
MFGESLPAARDPTSSRLRSGQALPAPGGREGGPELPSRHLNGGTCTFVT